MASNTIMRLASTMVVACVVASFVATADGRAAVSSSEDDTSGGRYDLVSLLRSIKRVAAREAQDNRERGSVDGDSQQHGKGKRRQAFYAFSQCEPSFRCFHEAANEFCQDRCRIPDCLAREDTMFYRASVIPACQPLATPTCMAHRGRESCPAHCRAAGGRVGSSRAKYEEAVQKCRQRITSLYQSN